MFMQSADSPLPSTRPYLIRALHEWCDDHGFTPYLAIKVGPSVRVPMEHVDNGEIVLNVSFSATSGLRLGDDFIEFQARFGGVPRDIVIPVDHVIAIYARENGQGMSFPAPTAQRSSPALAPVSKSDGLSVQPAPVAGDDRGDGDDGPSGAPPAPGRSHLRRVK